MENNPNQIPKEHRRRYAYNYFLEEAKRQNQRNYPVDIKTIFDDTGRQRITMVMPQSLGDCYLITSLFPSLKETYPNSDLYVATQPQFMDVFLANPHVHKVIPFMPAMENELFWIGAAGHPGYVDIAFLPYIQTQKQLNYLRNGVDKIAFQIKKKKID
jgi:hypothetical protein